MTSVSPALGLGPLERDVGCRAELLWRFDVAGAAEVETLSTRLVAAGLACESSQGAPAVLRVLELIAGGHRLVLVPRTGRVQIRLSAYTPRPDRCREADRIYALLNDCVGLPIAQGRELRP